MAVEELACVHSKEMTQERDGRWTIAVREQRDVADSDANKSSRAEQ